MPKLYASREIVKALKRAGFAKVSQRGSYLQMKGIWNGRIQSILAQSSMSKIEFERLVK